MDVPVLRADVGTVWDGQGEGSGDDHVRGTTGDFWAQENLGSIRLEAVQLGKNKREKHVKEWGDTWMRI